MPRIEIRNRTLIRWLIKCYPFLPQNLPFVRELKRIFEEDTYFGQRNWDDYGEVFGHHPDIHSLTVVYLYHASDIKKLEKWYENSIRKRLRFTLDAEHIERALKFNFPGSLASFGKIADRRLGHVPPDAARYKLDDVRQVSFYISWLSPEYCIVVADFQLSGNESMKVRGILNNYNLDITQIQSISSRPHESAVVLGVIEDRQKEAMEKYLDDLTEKLIRLVKLPGDVLAKDRAPLMRRRYVNFKSQSFGSGSLYGRGRDFRSSMGRKLGFEFPSYNHKDSFYFHLLSSEYKAANTSTYTLSNASTRHLYEFHKTFATIVGMQNYIDHLHKRLDLLRGELADEKRYKRAIGTYIDRRIAVLAGELHTLRQSLDENRKNFERGLQYSEGANLYVDNDRHKMTPKIIVDHFVKKTKGLSESAAQLQSTVVTSVNSYNAAANARTQRRVNWLTAASFAVALIAFVLSLVGVSVGLLPYAESNGNLREYANWVIRFLGDQPKP